MCLYEVDTFRFVEKATLPLRGSQRRFTVHPWIFNTPFINERWWLVRSLRTGKILESVQQGKTSELELNVLLSTDPWPSVSRILREEEGPSIEDPCLMFHKV